MAIQVVKGPTSSSEAITAPRAAEQEQAKEAVTNVGKIANSAASVSTSTEAVISNVRNNRVDKTGNTSRVRDFSEARDLADSVAGKIRTGKTEESGGAHGGLEARGAASHLA